MDAIESEFEFELSSQSAVLTSLEYELRTLIDTFNTLSTELNRTEGLLSAHIDMELISDGIVELRNFKSTIGDVDDLGLRVSQMDEVIIPNTLDSISKHRIKIDNLVNGLHDDVAEFNKTLRMMHGDILGITPGLMDIMGVGGGMVGILTGILIYFDQWDVIRHPGYSFVIGVMFILMVVFKIVIRKRALSGELIDQLRLIK